MQNTRKIMAEIIVLSFLLVYLSACAYQFTYSPNLTNPHYSEVTEKNSQTLLNNSIANFSPFKIYVASDSHNAYDELELFRKMANQSDISFFIVAGDFTDEGLLEEYEYFHQHISKLNVPYFYSFR